MTEASLWVQITSNCALWATGNQPEGPDHERLCGLKDIFRLYTVITSYLCALWSHWRLRTWYHDKAHFIFSAGLLFPACENHNPPLALPSSSLLWVVSWNLPLGNADFHWTSLKALIVCVLCPRSSVYKDLMTQKKELKFGSLPSGMPERRRDRCTRRVGLKMRQRHRDTHTPHTLSLLSRDRRASLGPDRVLMNNFVKWFYVYRQRCNL